MLHVILWICVLAASAAAGALVGLLLNRFRIPPTQGGDSC